MTLFKNNYKTDSNRLKNWDYSSEAIYFITLVTQNRECIFGTIENGKMFLNQNGQIIENELLKSIKIRKNWFFHNWIVMPNHLHLLIEIQKQNEIISAKNIVEAHSSASPPSISPTIVENITETDSLDIHNVDTHSVETHNVETHCSASLQSQSDTKLSRKPNSISSFVAVFKSITTKQINGSESIWQANYHDHIVRNYKTFDKIYQYIKTNPRNWDTDSINSNFQ